MQWTKGPRDVVPDAHMNTLHASAGPRSFLPTVHMYLSTGSPLSPLRHISKH